MHTALVRLLLLLVYVGLSWALSLHFIRSDGYGSHAPPAILFSWAVLPSEYSLVSKPVGFWIIPLFYLLSLFGLATACARSWRALSFLPFVIHGVGVVVALMTVTQHPEHGADATAGFMRASYVTAALLAAGYFFCDWWLARKDREEFTSLIPASR